MKLTFLALALAGTLICTGCSEVITLHPFVTDKDAVQEPRFAGVWVDGDNLYIVRPDGNSYTVAYSNSDKDSHAVYKLNAKLLKVAGATILDVPPAEDDAFRVPAHTPVRVWADGAALRFAFLDSKWLREHAQAELAVEQVNDRWLITSPQEAVTRFLLTYAADERAFGKVNTLTRQQ